MARGRRTPKEWLLLVVMVAAGVVASAVVAVVAQVFWAQLHAEQIMADGKSLIGKPSQAMTNLYGQPHWVRLARPQITETATGRVVRTFDPYEVWYYCPWPRVVPIGPCLQVFVVKGRITRLKDPLY